MTKIWSRAELESRGALVRPNPAHLSQYSDPMRREGITWHWTGADGTLFRPDPLTRLRAIQAEHMQGRGYGDIAYNAAFDVDGNLFELRDQLWVGAHALSNGNQANERTLGVVFLEDARGLTAGGAGAMELAVYLFHMRYERAPLFWGHRDWARNGGTPTQCPGDQLEAFQAFITGLHRKAA